MRGYIVLTINIISWLILALYGASIAEPPYIIHKNYELIVIAAEISAILTSFILHVYYMRIKRYGRPW